MWNPFKKKAALFQTDNLKISSRFESILSANAELKFHFEDLVNRFVERTWTPEVCSLFKLFAEDLFKSFGISATFHVNPCTKGMGSFTVEVHGAIK